MSGSHNPFVLVNHSPTLCLNPPLLSREDEVLAILVGTEKRSDGGSVRSQFTTGQVRDRHVGTGELPVSGSQATRRTAFGLILGAPLLGACSSVQQSLSQFTTSFSSSPQPTGGQAGPAQQPVAVGNGQVKVGIILPLSAAGNAGVAAQSMKNASEMALSEFLNPNLQLLIKDDGGNAQGAQQAAQQALDEGAEIILGPLFASSVPSVAQAARGKGINIIAFSTDSNVANRGVYLLSFLPESDVNRIIEYAASQGKRSFAAMLPENAYGNVVEAAFRQAVPKRAAGSSHPKNMAPIAPRRRATWPRRSARPMRCFLPTTAMQW